jgi:hypothetical protein
MRWRLSSAQSLDVPLAVLIDVIDYPCLPLDAGFFPSAFANCIPAQGRSKNPPA